MRQIKNRFLSMILVTILILATAIPAFGAEAATTAAGADAEASMNKAAVYIYSTVTEPIVASVGGEWAVLGLARSGYNVPQSYYDKYYQNVVDELKATSGVLHEKKYTEYSRVILALTAIGKDVTNVGGYNLLEKLADFDAVKWQGINGTAYALIALDSHGYEIPQVSGVTTQTTRELLIKEILSKEITTTDGVQGGFALSRNVPDADVTGMVLQALSNYTDRADVKSAIERAVIAVDKMENENGGFESWQAANSESVVQVIVAKSALYTKDTLASEAGANLDALLEYQLTNGSFEHVLKGGTNLMSSEQGLYAMAAYVRSMYGQTSLYDMSDVKIAKDIVTTPLEAGVSVAIDGTNVLFTEASGSPFIDANNRTQVPLRVTMESYGCEVTWDNVSKIATVSKDGITVKVPIGQNYILVDNANVEIDSAALIKDNRTYLPIRAVLEAFGATVTWDTATKTVVVEN